MVPGEDIQLERHPEEPPPPGSVATVELGSDGVPKGFEERVVIALAGIPRDQSIHKTLQILADMGTRHGVTLKALKHFFLTNEAVFQEFAHEIGDAMEARLTLPHAPLSELPRESIEHAVSGMVDYFLESVEQGSLYEHLGKMEDGLDPQARENFYAVLASEKFQQVVMQAFRPFITTILDKICGVSAVQAEVREDLPLWAAVPDDDDDESPDDLMTGPITAPFDLLKRFKADGADVNSRRQYIQSCLRASPPDKLNRRFYWSDDGRPHLASERRKSAPAAAPIES